MKLWLEAETPPTVFAVFADPPAGREQELQDWYETVHGPDAIGNGSFTALHRFRAVGPGHVAAPYLALWIGRFRDEAEAWAYISPRAAALREAGRVGDIASVRFAIMLFGAAVAGSIASDDVRSIVTVQNDWRHAATAPAARDWYGAVPEGDARTRWLATSDAAGRGAGHHLAVLAGGDAVDGQPGMSPLPAYRTIFGEDAGAIAADDEIPPSPAWTMQWESLGSMRA
jgi:hypothetical protein